MRKYKMTTAIKKAHFGEFEFVYNPRVGLNCVRKPLPDGRKVDHDIFITVDDRKESEK